MNEKNNQRTIITCLYCFKEKLVYNCLANRKFCDNVCKSKYQEFSLIAENNPNWRGGLVSKVCDFCKSEIKMKICRVGMANTHFCNNKCYAEYQKTSLKGKKPNLFNMGMKINYEKYGLGFEEKYKNCIRIGTGGIKHEICKMILAKKILDFGHDFYTEVRLKNGIIDVLDFDSMIAYEVQNNMHKDIIAQKESYSEGNILSEIIIIDINRVNLSNWEETIDYLKSKIKI